MTSLEIIQVPPDTVITSNDGRSTLSVHPGQTVAKGHRLFVVKEDFEWIVREINKMHEWSDA